MVFSSDILHPSLLHDCSHKASIAMSEVQAYGEQVGGDAEIRYDPNHVGSASRNNAVSLSPSGFTISAAATSGTGNARRSILPFGVNGISFNGIMTEGTINSVAIPT